MENWDEAKLRDVVTQQGRKQTNATDVSVLLLVSPVDEGPPPGPGPGPAGRRRRGLWVGRARTAVSVRWSGRCGARRAKCKVQGGRGVMDSKRESTRERSRER